MSLSPYIISDFFFFFVIGRRWGVKGGGGAEGRREAYSCPADDGINEIMEIIISPSATNGYGRPKSR